MKAAFVGIFKRRRGKHKVSEFSDEDSGSLEPKMMSTNGELGGSLTDFGQKKSALLSKMNSTSASSNCFSTSSSEKMLKSSSSSTSVSSSKKAQIRHAVTSSSTSASCQEMKKQQQQQNEIFQQENRNFSRSVSVTSNASSSSDSRLKLLSCSGFSVDDEASLSRDQGTQESIKFEKQQQQQKVTSSSSKVKMNSSTTAEGYTEEKMAAINQERKQVRSGSVSYEESSTTAALQHKLEADGFTTEKVAALRQDQRQLKTPDSLQQQQRTAMASSMKLSTDEFTAEKIAVAKQEEMRSFSAQGMVQAEKNVSASSSSKVTFTSKNNIAKSAVSSQNMHQVDFRDVSSPCLGMLSLTGSNMEPFSYTQNKEPVIDITDGMDKDAEFLKKSPVPGPEVDKVIERFSSRMTTCVEKLKNASDEETLALLDSMNKILRSAWALPCYGHDLGAKMCKMLLDNGAVDILIDNCVSSDTDIQFRSAKVLEQCLSTENRTYVVNNGLEQVVKAACFCSATSLQSRVGTGILEHLFKHSEKTCSDVIRMGGLKAILFNCRSSDVETLRHCAQAFANLSLYGGPENQHTMIRYKVAEWLYPLAFQDDDNTKYYGLLAISSLVANKEIEAAVLKSGTLDLVEPFVTSHSPENFAKSHITHGQSENWLQRLVSVLDSKREEARNLAAFHFAMEAGIKQKQGNTKIFHDIGGVEALKKVASSPNAIASKFAARALLLIGEQVPHKLSQQVPLWTGEDVQEWVKQIGFERYCTEFSNSRIDGDLLLQLTEEMLRSDIGIQNGILRKRFLRELNQLKQMADYTSCDSTCLNQILQNLGPEFCQYTYQMLHCGLQTDTLKYISEEQLARDCGVENSIHRLRIAHAIQGLAEQSESAEEVDKNQKPLDAFVSYRRSNGSQLASLLKVHLHVRNFSVFIDVDRLEAGKFDNNLLKSIQQAKNFILVLTPNALDRCIGDNECKDWVHKEIVEALQSECNIIPILDNFKWPEPDTLPEDMKQISTFNGVNWVHDYQDAAVDKLERFMRGEMIRSDGPLGRLVSIASGGAGTPIATATSLPGATAGVLPATKSQPTMYQRSLSTDNTLTAADKECCNGPINGRDNEISHNHFGN